MSMCSSIVGLLKLMDEKVFLVFSDWKVDKFWFYKLNMSLSANVYEMASL